MRLKPLIVAVLLRLYPAAWREKYGVELADLILARPLSVHVVGDVLLNGLWQRGRAAEPSSLVGSAMMLVVLTGLAANLAIDAPGGHDLTTWLRPSSKTLPTVTATFLVGELYVLLMVGCGCWTALCSGSRSGPGVAAMRTCFIAGLPVMLTGLLMWSGVVVLKSGNTMTPLGVLVAPMFRLPESWIWGALGGQIGARISRYRSPAAS